MAGNETTINARITLDASSLRGVPAAFNPATAAANQFGQAAERAGKKMDTFGSKAQKAMRMASRVRGIAGQIGYAASSLGLEGTVGETISGVLSGGTTGAMVGGLAGIKAGPWGAAIGGGIGAIWGGVTGYLGAGTQEEAAKKAATEKNTQALIEVMRELQELRQAQAGMTDAQGRATLAEAIRDYTAEARSLKRAGASERQATEALTKEAYLEGIEDLKQSGEKNADKLARDVVGTVATLGQTAEIVKRDRRDSGPSHGSGRTH